MPSHRPATLAPRGPAAAPAAANTAPHGGPPAAASGRAARKPGAKNTAASVEPVDEAPAGGFHESTYELQSGLQITESEWPDDVTVPGGLGHR